MMLLEGLKVLDLSRILAGPLASQVLADMGADVLKIESPSGDDTRGWGPPFQDDMAAYFQSCNRNKASLVLNLKSEPDIARLKELVGKADVVLDNFPPSLRRRLNLTADKLQAINPKLICMSITGYTGTRLNEPGYDAMIQAESGLMGITGAADGNPYKVGVAVVDVLTGMMAANGILAGLYQRNQRAIGAQLSISLYRTALFSLVNVASNYLVSDQPSKRWGNAHANIVPYQPFEMADRQILIGAGNDAQFRRLCSLLDIGHREIVDTSNATRVANREEILKQLQTKLKPMTSEPFMKKLTEARIPHAPILRPDEAIAKIRTWDSEAVIAMNHQAMGTVKGIANPITGNGMRHHHTPPPQLNEGGETMAAAWLNS